MCNIIYLYNIKNSDYIYIVTYVSPDTIFNYFVVHDFLLNKELTIILGILFCSIIL